MIYVSKLLIQRFAQWICSRRSWSCARDVKRHIFRAWPSDSLIKGSLCLGKRHYFTMNTLGLFILVGWVRFFSDGCILDIAYRTFNTLPVMIIYNNNYVEISRRPYQLNTAFFSVEQSTESLVNSWTNQFSNGISRWLV